ncbi:hypothetical protein BRADI_1g21112v3 [Brachypodium distachyon]|uniref:Uncharacterized protein n=1 Tax=Brachypodium distachyon TaxID=15368 RepID=A0A2K2DKD2_BRADI|nr:hypothetical protein BRADI_1g21112v3 [Brachypodium distachyon]
MAEGEGGERGGRELWSGDWTCRTRHPHDGVEEDDPRRYSCCCGSCVAAIAIDNIGGQKRTGALSEDCLLKTNLIFLIRRGRQI